MCQTGYLTEILIGRTFHPKCTKYHFSNAGSVCITHLSNIRSYLLEMCSVWVEPIDCYLITAELFEAVQTTAREPESRWWQEKWEEAGWDRTMCLERSGGVVCGFSQVSHCLPPAEWHIGGKVVRGGGGGGGSHVGIWMLLPSPGPRKQVQAPDNCRNLMDLLPHFIISAIFIVDVIVLNCYGYNNTCM